MQHQLSTPDRVSSQAATSDRSDSDKMAAKFERNESKVRLLQKWTHAHRVCGTGCMHRHPTAPVSLRKQRDSHACWRRPMSKTPNPMSFCCEPFWLPSKIQRCEDVTFPIHGYTYWDFECRCRGVATPTNSVRARPSRERAPLLLRRGADIQSFGFHNKYRGC